MNFFWVILSLGLAFILEWMTGGRMAILGTALPMTEAVMVFWFWRLDLWNKVLLAVIGGVLLDEFSPYVFGSVTSVFILLAVLTDLLRRFLLNADSLFVRSFTLGVGIFFVLVMSALLDIFLSDGWRSIVPSVYGIYAANLAGALAWSVIFSSGYGAVLMFKRSFVR